MISHSKVFEIPQQELTTKVDESENEYIDSECLDYNSYNAKMRMWRDLLNAGILNSDDERCRKKAWQLLDTDSTLYAYTFFNDPRSGGPLTFTAYQDAISMCKHDGTADGDNRYVLFRASNQIGKSILLNALSIEKVLKEDNITVGMFSKTLPQSQDLLRQIKHFLNNSSFADTWKEDTGDQANTTVLSFKRELENGGVSVSRIVCAPATEGSLGYAFDYLFLDEGDFYEDAKDFFWKVAHPRTKATKGQVILFSNPNVSISRNESLLWELWNGSLFNNKFWFNFNDAPWNSKEEFERDRVNTPSHIFASTHLGEFPDEAGSFLSDEEIRDMLNKEWGSHTLPAVDRPIYIGVDIGKMNDNSVIWIGYKKKPARDIEKFDDLDAPYCEVLPLKTPYDQIADRIEEIVDFYEQNYNGVNDVGVDSTGQKTFNDLLKSRGIHHTAVDFASSRSSKTKLYNDFKLMAENRKLRIAYSAQIQKQLSGLTFKYTPTKKLRTVANRSNSIHDDIPDALAILIHVAIRFGQPAVGGSIAVPKPKDINEGSANHQELVAKTIRENNAAATNKRMNPYGAMNFR